MSWSTAFTALGGTATINIPDASSTARGLVSTGSQVFAGAKTFAVAPTFSGFTLGSVLFVSTGGLLAQDNTNFFWDNTNKRIGLGTVTPNAKLEINSGVAGTGGLRFTQLTSASTGTTNN